MDRQDVDIVDQFSDDSRRALVESVDRLVDQLRQHTATVTALHGGSSELRALFEANDAVDRFLRDWADRAFDHTGTRVLPWVPPDEPDEDDDLDDEHHEAPPADQQHVSVVSRWDLAVVDAEAFLAEARAAHRRNRPEETEEDAVVGVAHLGAALYAIRHEKEDAWLRVPGVQVLGGARVYVTPSEDPVEPRFEEEREALDAVRLPEGRIVYSEMSFFGPH